MKKRILMITLRTDLGGGPKHLLDLMSEIHENSKFELYFAGPKDEPFGSPLRSLANASCSLNHRRFLLKDLQKLLAFCRIHKIDLIHSHGRGAGVYSRLLGLLLGIPIVHSFHGLFSDRSFFGRVKSCVDLILNFWTDQYIFVSGDEFQVGLSMKILGSTPSKVIPNGINVKSFAKPSERPNSLDTKTEITIGNLSRNDRAKGNDLLLKHIRYFRNKHPGIRFKIIMAGSGLENLELPVELKEQIKLPGRIYPPHAFFGSIDLYVSSSLHEGLPLSVLEAMASGVPCLLSQVKGHLSFIDDESAVGFELENSKDFSEKLFNIIKNTELRSRISQRALEQVQQHNDLKSMASAIAETYVDVLSRSSSVRSG